MTLRSNLLACAAAHSKSAGISVSRLSTIIFNDGKTLARVAAGGDVVTASYERAIAWFSANWPEGLAWPSDVPRPSLPVVDTQAGAGAAGIPLPAAPVCVSEEA